MITEKKFTRGAIVALAAGLAALGYNQMRARADGIPSASPLVYAGTLEDGGRPVDGTRNFRLTVYDDATSMESSRIRCITNAPGTMVGGGRFQIPLDGACTAAVRATPDLWMEVEVNGASLGRTKFAAVPFAVEAARAQVANRAVSADSAASATGALARLTVPPGAVIPFDLPSCPDGWTEFLEARGRTVVGVNPTASPGLTARMRREAFGTESESLTVSQMPSHGHGLGTLAISGGGEHQHQIPCRSSPDGVHGHHAFSGTLAEGPSSTNGFCPVAPTTTVAGGHSHNLIGAVGTSGSGQPYNNIQPSLALLYCRKQ